MAAAPPPPKPGARRRKRSGCRSCCLFLVLGPIVGFLLLLLVTWAWPRLRRDPVEKEWKSIPGYLDRSVRAAGGAGRA